MKIGIIEILDRGPMHTIYAKAMRVNLASIMPQVLAVWCEEAGHEVFPAYYNGYENMMGELPKDLDMVFIGAFTQSALVAYALSRIFQKQGAVTVLGGPHARCYPEDAKLYFDYVCGFTSKELFFDLLKDHRANRPEGVYLEAAGQPKQLPGVKQRWKFIKPLLDMAPYLKIIPMISSMGCPYRCDFCIDADVPFQPVDYDCLKEDLKFLQTQVRRPIVAWHDPNFGIRFDEIMSIIEEASPKGRIRYIAESSLSLLTEENVKRLKKNKFMGLIPGVESWNEKSGKIKAGNSTGAARVEKVAEQLNMIFRYIPYIQANFVLGLDCDSGDEPFELSKKFLDLSPATFPGFSLLTAFGQAAPLNSIYKKEGRIVDFPFHFLDNTFAMNVRPKHYSWPEFYDHLISLQQYAFSKSLVRRRFFANRRLVPRVLNLLKAKSFEGEGKVRYFSRVRAALDNDITFRKFFEQETREVPEFFTLRLKRDLGPLYSVIEDSLLPKRFG